MQENLRRNDASQSGGVVDKPAVGGFVQSREFYRVRLDKTLKWQLLDPTGQELDTHVGDLTDISGGGLCFTTDCQAAPGDRMHILLTDLPIIEKLDTHVTVVRAVPLEEEKTEEEEPEEQETEAPPAWKVACVLDELSNRMRDRLISSIFEQQRRAIFKSRQEEAEEKEREERAQKLADALH